MQVFSLEVQSQTLAFQHMDVCVARIPALLRHVDPSLKRKLRYLTRLRDDSRSHRFVFEAFLDPNLKSGLRDVELGLSGRIKEVHRAAQEAVVNARREHFSTLGRVIGWATNRDENEFCRAVSAQGANADARRHELVGLGVKNLKRPRHRGLSRGFSGRDGWLADLPCGRWQGAVCLVRVNGLPNER